MPRCAAGGPVHAGPPRCRGCCPARPSRRSAAQAGAAARPSRTPTRTSAPPTSGISLALDARRVRPPRGGRRPGPRTGCWPACAALADGEPAARRRPGRGTAAVGRTVFVFPGQGAQWPAWPGAARRPRPVFAAATASSATQASGPATWTGRWSTCCAAAADAPSTDAHRRRAAGAVRGDGLAGGTVARARRASPPRWSATRRARSPRPTCRGTVPGRTPPGSSRCAARRGRWRRQGGMLSVRPPRSRSHRGSRTGPTGYPSRRATARLRDSPGIAAPCDELLARARPPRIKARGSAGRGRSPRTRRTVDRFGSGCSPTWRPSCRRPREIPLLLDGDRRRRWTRRELDADYWYRTCADRCEFERAVRPLLADGHSTSSSAARTRCCARRCRRPSRTGGRAVSVAARCAASEGGRTGSSPPCAEVHARGGPVDWQAVFADARRACRLPTYAFQRQRYWLEAPAATATWPRPGSTPADHPLLGAAVRGRRTRRGCCSPAGSRSRRSPGWPTTRSRRGAGARHRVRRAGACARASGRLRLRSGAHPARPLAAAGARRRGRPGRRRRGGRAAGRGGGGVLACRRRRRAAWAAHAADRWRPEPRPANCDLLDVAARRRRRRSPSRRSTSGWPSAASATARDSAGCGRSGGAATTSSPRSAAGRAPTPPGFGLHPALLDAALHARAGRARPDEAPGASRCRSPGRASACTPPARAELRVRWRPPGRTRSSLTVADASAGRCAPGRALVLRPMSAEQLRHAAGRADALSGWTGSLRTGVGPPVALGEASRGRRAAGWHADARPARPPVPDVVHRSGGFAGTPRPVADGVAARGARRDAPRPRRGAGLAGRRRLRRVPAGGRHPRRAVARRATAPDLAPPPCGAWYARRSGEPGPVRPGRHRRAPTPCTLCRPRSRPASRSWPSATGVAPRRTAGPRCAAAARGGGAPLFDPDGTVLITGGTGGLGAAAGPASGRRHGVRQLRAGQPPRAAAPGAAELRAELSRARRRRSTVAACDVADREGGRRLLAEIAASASADRGGPHGRRPGRRRDRVADARATGRGAAPEGRRGGHLHELTRDLDLSALRAVLLGAGGLRRRRGRRNYAAANAFLDALAAHRRAQRAARAVARPGACGPTAAA